MKFAPEIEREDNEGEETAQRIEVKFLINAEFKKKKMASINHDVNLNSN